MLRVESSSLVPAALMAAFLALLSSGCPMGGGESDYARAQKAQQSVREQLEGMGATFEEKQFAPPAGKGFIVALHGPIGPEFFKLVQEMGSIHELNLSKSGITDEQLKELPPGIRVLDLSETAISDQGLQNLKEKKGIFELNLKGSKCTEPGVKEYTKATEMRAPPEFGGRIIPRKIEF